MQTSAARFLQYYGRWGPTQTRNQKAQPPRNAISALAMLLLQSGWSFGWMVLHSQA
jgi:hypothetical protein